MELWVVREMGMMGGRCEKNRSNGYLKKNRNAWGYGGWPCIHGSYACGYVRIWDFNGGFGGSLGGHAWYRKWVAKETGLQGIEGNGFGGWMKGRDVGRGDEYDDGDDGVWKLKDGNVGMNIERWRCGYGGFGKMWRVIRDKLWTTSMKNGEMKVALNAAKMQTITLDVPKRIR